MAPAMQGLRYDDAQRQAQVGAAREAMLQQQRQFGWEQLARYQGLIGGVPGASGTSKTTEQRPWWQDALGVASTAAGYAGMFNPPVGPA
jgi:subtilase family serine protease